MKKIVALLLTVLLALSLFAFSACSTGNGDDPNKNDNQKTIKVGASPAPHAEILEEARAYIESKGYKLEIVEFTDYIQPNVSTNDGSLDANFFQHKPYLDKFNTDHKMNLISVLAVHFEPLGLYKGAKGNTIADAKTGDKIAIPDDATNGARALQLLDSEGIIDIINDRGLDTTIKDIDSKGIEIIPLEAGTIGVRLPELTFAVINTNYALDFKLQDKRLASEKKGGIAADTYGNIIAVKSENKDSEKTKILIEALTQPNIKNFIENNYKGDVIPLV